MAEGATFAWKIQKIDMHRGPVGTYNQILRPLPSPPKDMHWVQDLGTKEWQLVRLVPKDGPTDEAEIDATAFALEEDPLESKGYHRIQPTDTFAGICLRYKVTPLELRRANGGFSGTNLHLVPNPLKIPRNSHNESISWEQEVDNPRQMIQSLLLSYPKMAATEARCYLELNDWNVEDARDNAREDGF